MIRILKKPLYKDLNKNLDYLKNELGADINFDVLTREFEIGHKKAGLIFLDGFIKDEIIFPLKFLMNTTRKEISVDVISKILKKRLPYYEIDILDNFEDIIDQILCGPQVLFLEGFNKAIIIDGRSWDTRSPNEPELEKSTRGPADGFVETMLFNIVAVRRRIRDKNFRAEPFQIGRRSKNDIALVYIEDITNEKLLKEIKNKLKNVDIDGLPLADKSIEDILTGGTINPLPMVRYTERPDNVAAHILEGHIAIIVDNSPTALILPAPFLSHVQTLESYRKGIVVGTYFSFMRILAMFSSVILPVLWLILATNRGILPEILDFIGPREEYKIGLGLQFVLASIGIDLIRMASIQTPNVLATSLSLIGALLLGEFAVEVGLFSPEVILYMAIATIANFAIPGYEMALVLKLVRLVLIISVIIGNITGVIITLILIFLWFAFSKSFGVYYLWPLIPFDYRALKSLVFNQSVLDLHVKRPDALNTKDSIRAYKNKEDN